MVSLSNSITNRGLLRVSSFYLMLSQSRNSSVSSSDQFQTPSEESYCNCEFVDGSVKLMIGTAIMGQAGRGAIDDRQTSLQAAKMYLPQSTTRGCRMQSLSGVNGEEHIYEDMRIILDKTSHKSPNSRRCTKKMALFLCGGSALLFSLILLLMIIRIMIQAGQELEKERRITTYQSGSTYLSNHSKLSTPSMMAAISPLQLQPSLMQEKSYSDLAVGGELVNLSALIFTKYLYEVGDF